MRDTTLPSPGRFGHGPELRKLAAACISATEVAASRTPGGKVNSATALATFFTACATAATAVADTTVPTAASAATNAAGTIITVTWSEPIDASVTPATTAFVPSGGKTVTAVATAVGGATTAITVNTAYANGATITLGYTKPATNYIRDRATNALATLASLAVTNNVPA